MTQLLSNNIFLTGFMATRKSRVGSALASKLGWEFFDTDKLIEEKAGATVAEIFANQGEEAFREMETQTISELTSRQNTIIALGGGALLRPKNLEIIRSSGKIVRLWAPVEVLSERIGRKN